MGAKVPQGPFRGEQLRAAGKADLKAGAAANLAQKSTVLPPKPAPPPRPPVSEKK